MPEHSEDADPENNKEYLRDLLQPIKKAYAGKETIRFRVVEPRARGFVVKVQGLFAYVSYRHFAWSYPSVELWQNVAKYLVGKTFTGIIHALNEDPISIRIDGTGQVYRKPDLVKYRRYRGVVVQRTKYGVFVDLGLHFDWGLGSVMGLVHKSNLKKESDYEHWHPGDEITIVFQGYNDKEQPVLGDNFEIGKWRNGEMSTLIGTVQKVDVIINNNRTELYVLGRYEGKAPLLKEFYGMSKWLAKRYKYELKSGDVIDCEVVRINKRKDAFVLKFLLDYEIS